jgi:hypothetical protein
MATGATSSTASPGVDVTADLMPRVQCAVRQRHAPADDLNVEREPAGRVLVSAAGVRP